MADELTILAIVAVVAQNRMHQRADVARRGREDGELIDLQLGFPTLSCCWSDPTRRLPIHRRRQGQVSVDVERVGTRLTRKAGKMVQRVTLPTRNPYNTLSNRRRIIKTPGGKLRYLRVNKLASAPKCGDCHVALPGVRPHRLHS